MSLPVIAIVVASVSALFTGANMFVSLATFRRGRPRVYVNADWSPYPYDARDGDADRIFRIHLVNNSQATVKVAQVYVEYSRGRTTFLHKRSFVLRFLNILEGEEDNEIAPNGGVRLKAQAPAFLRPPLSFISRVRLTAVLTNGMQFRSKWIYKPDPQEWGDSPHSEQQLSFDDLEEVQ